MNGKQIPLIQTSDEITAEWMQQALAAGGAIDCPSIAAVEAERLSEVTNMLGNLYRCRLIAPGGVAAVPASVIVKFPTSNALAFRLAKWLSLHRREYVFYQDIAALGCIRVPSLFYGDYDRRSNRSVLVLEDLGGMNSISQVQGATVEQAQRAIREIAGFQGRFWEVANDPSLSACGPFLSTGESRIMQTLYLLTLPPTLERFGDVFSTAARRQAETFGPGIAAHFAAVPAGPKTIVHGDFRVDNMMFGDDSEEALTVIDWQGCGIGCGMYDVAFFMSNSITIDQRRRTERDTVEEYHDIVCRMGAKNYTRDDCWRSYRQNMLGTLMPMVIGCGAIEMNNQAIVNQSRELLGRVLTAIDDLNAWEFLPAGEPFLSTGWGFSALSRCGYQAYRLALRLRRKGRSKDTV